MPVGNNAAGAQGGAGTTSDNSAAGQGSAGSYVVNNGEDGNNAGAQGGARGGAGGGARSQREVREQGAQTIVDRLVQRYGTIERALDVLAGDNYDLRESNRELQDKLRLIPPNGAVVLVGDDAKAWSGFKALNLPPDKVKERLDEHATLQQQQQRAALGSAAEQAAAAVGYKNPALLGELLSDKALQLDMRDTVVVQADKTTKSVKMPYVRKQGDTNGHYIPLADYLTANHPAFLPALNTPVQGTGGGNQQGQGGAQGGAAGTAGQSTNGTQQSAQGAGGHVVVLNDQASNGNGGGAGSADPIAARIAAQNAAAARPNALRPAAAK